MGHYIRSKIDPLEAIEKLKDRLYGVHFKDFSFDDGKEKERIPGDGNLKIKETLAALKKVIEAQSKEYGFPAPEIVEFDAPAYIAKDGKSYASGTQLAEGSYFGRRAGRHAAAR